MIIIFMRENSYFYSILGGKWKFCDAFTIPDFFFWLELSVKMAILVDIFDFDPFVYIDM